jgi:hypothetical protein
MIIRNLPRRLTKAAHDSVRARLRQFFRKAPPRGINIARLQIRSKPTERRWPNRRSWTFLGHRVPNDTITQARWTMRLVELARDSGN